MFREVTETLRSFRPSSRQLRYFGLILGALIAILSQAERADAVGGSAAGAAIAALALALPGTIEPLWRALMAITLPIGWVVSRLILIALFYLVLTPLSFLLSLTGRDILKLKRGGESYWEPFEKNRHPDTMGL